MEATALDPPTTRARRRRGRRRGRREPATPPASPTPRGPARWSEREAIYRLVYHLEARLDALEKENGAGTTLDGRPPRDRRQLGRHVDVLRTVQTRLNMVMVLMISVGLFALAGPGGLYDIMRGDRRRAGGLDPDGHRHPGGRCRFPLLYPLGRRIFLSVRPDLPQKEPHG